MPAASVIIPARNAAATVGALLGALSGQRNCPSYEVILVDDGSDDETVSIARSSQLPIRVIEQKGRGPGEARNAGVAASRGELLAFTDADCVPTAGWLAAGSAALDDADLAQGAVHADPAAARQPWDRTVWVTEEGGLYECASLFVKREVFDAVGGFEDPLHAKLGKQLGEDTWLGWRVRRSGFKTAFVPAALVHHAVFDRGPVEYAAERARLVYFPVLTRLIPELRRELLWHRWFLSRRTASFDLALVGALAAVLAGSWLPVGICAPYLFLLVRGAGRWRLRAAPAALTDVVADAIAAAALFIGSIRSRTPVL